MRTSVVFFLIGSGACAQPSALETETFCRIFSEADIALDVLEGCIEEALEGQVDDIQKTFVAQTQKTILERNILHSESMTEKTKNYCMCFRILMATVSKASPKVFAELDTIRGVIYNLDGVRRRLAELTFLESLSPKQAHTMALLETVEMAAQRLQSNLEALKVSESSAKVEKAISGIEHVLSDVRSQNILSSVSLGLVSAEVTAKELAARIERLIKVMKSFEPLLQDAESGVTARLWIHGILLDIPEMESLLQEVQDFAYHQPVTADEFLAEWRSLHREFPDLAPPPSVDLQYTLSV
jgi:hypothetical protein